MNSSSQLRRFIKVILLGLIGATPPLFSQGVATTGSVGLLSLPAQSASDTIVSLPLHRPDVFRGSIASVAGSVVTLRQASFQEDAFNGLFYLLLESGSGEGSWFPITDTTGATITVDLGLGIGAGVLVGDVVVKIIPFWTLDAVFPNGKGVNASGSLLPVTRVLLPDYARAGVRLAPSSSFLYYSGSGHGGEGWRKFGYAPSVKFDNQILPPASSLIVRHDSGAGTVFENLGHVQTSSYSVLLGTIAANTAQDHSLGVGLPTLLSLSESGLFESGAFSASSDLDQPVDQLLVFDQSSPARNRVPSSTYYYYSGSQNGGPGWRLLGDSGTIRDGAAVFQPARGFVIRKAAGTIPVSSRWTLRPAYLDLP
ncbi:MAG: TIGR02597 family protein [Verrucomicrobiales bacterium]|nr:TIGR02597 family protein [Verrucomicrobiales bacterium]